MSRDRYRIHGLTTPHFLAWIGVWLLLGAMPLAWGAERVALVIGNGAYANAPYLTRPLQDARAMAKALGALGFSVTGPLLDQNKSQMDGALLQFGDRAQGAEAAVVYFSGHGMEVGGKNYLIPVDAVLKQERHVSAAVELDKVMVQLSGVRSYGLVILDACRDNPLADRMVLRDGRTKAVGGSKGLIRVEPGQQIYVAYAAKEGTVAQEGNSDHSPYTAALLRRLQNYVQQPLPLPNLFGAVREDVLAATQQAQEPWLYGAFGAQTIYLTDVSSAPPAPLAQPVLPPAPAVDHDLIAWQSAEKCGTAACFRAYLKKHPQGQYAEMAQARLEAEAAPPAPQVASASAPSPFRPTVPEEAPAEGSRPQAGQVFRDTLSDGTRGPALVVIPAGEFQMGSPESEAGRGSDERRHRVKIEKTFALGQYEVTVGEFRRFVAAKNYQTDAEKNAGGSEGCFISYREGNEWKYGYRAGFSWKKPNFQQGEDHPVVCVSWNDALAYVKWFSQETGQTYRLPTEAEWEYAARAVTPTARYWGDDPSQACRYANVADRTAEQTFLGWTIHDCTDGYVYTAPVGSFQPNAWKLYDMLGNVWEWTCSEWDEKYGGAESRCSTNNGTTGARAVRGGSWFYFPVRVRSALRFWYDPTHRNYYRGFRLARSL